MPRSRSRFGFPVAMVVPVSGDGIGVAMVSHRSPSPRRLRSPEQPPLSAASPRELIYNAHLGNTKELLSSSRFNVFSFPASRRGALSFLHVISSPPSYLPPSLPPFFSYFPLTPHLFVPAISAELLPLASSRLLSPPAQLPARQYQ